MLTVGLAGDRNCGRYVTRGIRWRLRHLRVDDPGREASYDSLELALFELQDSLRSSEALALVEERVDAPAVSKERRGRATSEA
jgi:hypothetical protein